MSARLHHEDLKVYQQAVAFVVKASEMGDGLPIGYAVKDQLQRAAESVPLNIAVSNAAQESAAQFQSLDYAAASVAECAACLDLVVVLDLDKLKVCPEQKRLLLGLFRMLAGLRRSRESVLREEPAEYGEPCFPHERLECYQQAVRLVAWAHCLHHSHPLPTRTVEVLDRSTTGVVMNIAEGNARTAPRDRARFFDTAVTSALRVAAALDVIVARRLAPPIQAAEGKDGIVVVVNLVLGLRRKALEE